MTNPKISVIICTRNRAEYLQKAIKSLLDQSLQKNLYEIIIMDNRSTDNTKDIIKKFSKSKNIRYIYEPILGLSQARNEGLKNARGKYVAFLDDEAVASKNWLETILETFESVKPRPGCIGGKIEPIWESPRPKWLSKETEIFITILDCSKKPTFLDRKKNLVGANMAFPRELLKEVGGFNTNLGRKGENLISCGEFIPQETLKRKGYIGFYHPKISVKHHIISSRLNKKWFKKRVFYEGVSNALVEQINEKPSPLQRMYKITKKIASLFLFPHQIIALMLHTDNPKWFTYKCIAIIKIGHIFGLIKRT